MVSIWAAASAIRQRAFNCAAPQLCPAATSPSTSAALFRGRSTITVRALPIAGHITDRTDVYRASNLSKGGDVNGGRLVDLKELKQRILELLVCEFALHDQPSGAGRRGFQFAVTRNVTGGIGLYAV